ncbi:MAG: DMT family transporter [Oscillospiraceae bacterium]|nr:DMT family transporter [Oscillospiraceae bacterium]
MNGGAAKRLAPLQILLAGALWGTMGLFIHRLDAVFGFTSMQIVFTRAVCSAVLLALVLLTRGFAGFKLRLRDVWCFLGTGLASIVFFNFCYFRAIMLTSMAVAAALLYTAPVFVGLISRVVFREALTARKVAAMCAALVGCFLTTGIVGNLGGVNAEGVLYGVGAGLGYALYSIFSRCALDRGYRPLTIAFYTFAVAAAGTALFAAPGAMLTSVVSASPVNIALLVVFALVTTVLPFLFYTTGLQNVAPGKASILASVEPVVAALIGVAVLREKMPPLTAAGVAIVVISIALLQLPGKKTHEKEELP